MKKKKSDMPIYIISLIILFAIAFFIQLDNQTIISYIESLQKEKISTEEFKNKAAIETSGKAYRLSILAIIISIAAIVVSMN